MTKFGMASLTMPQGSFMIHCLFSVPFSFHARVSMIPVWARSWRKKVPFSKVRSLKVLLTHVVLARKSYLTGCFHSCVLQGGVILLVSSHLQEVFDGPSY